MEPPVDSYRAVIVYDLLVQKVDYASPCNYYFSSIVYELAGGRVQTDRTRRQVDRAVFVDDSLGRLILDACRRAVQSDKPGS